MATHETNSTFLKIPYGFHSAQIEPILEEFQNIAAGVTFTEPHTPIVFCLTGSVIEGQKSISPAYLARQAREAVQFTKALSSCDAASFIGENSLVVEIGPDLVCLGIARRTLNIPTSAKLVASLKPSQGSWCTISAVLRAAYETGINIKWPEFHKDFQNSVRLFDLPTYAFDYKTFWTPYEEPETNQLTPIHSDIGKSQPPTYPGFIPSASVQRIESEKIESREITVIYASDISEPALLHAIEGHSVVGQKICPMVVFCDMAMSATKYAYCRLHGRNETPDMSIYNMDMTRALVLSKMGSRPIVSIRSIYEQDRGTASVTFYSHKAGGIVITYGACTVQLIKPNSQKDKNHQIDFFLRSRMMTLQELSKEKKAHTFLKPVVYRLFSNVVSYKECYQGLEEVVVDTGCSDGVGIVKLKATDNEGRFFLNPFWNDSAIHLCGFLLNSGLKYSEEDVFICPGFDSWHFLDSLSSEKDYTTYVYMQEVTCRDNSMVGNCYVFDGDRLVQELIGINFQKMGRGVPEMSLKGSATQFTTSDSEHYEPKPQSQQFKFSMKSANVSIPDQQTSRSSSSDGIETPETSNSDVIDMLLAIVARESGIPVDEMLDETAYIDIGVNSLIAVTIFTTLERETGFKLEASFFVEHTTIGEVKCALFERL
ncbi:polyketide synthase [Trichoderma arundinaceum]|uniref:Polyketide synthase n=1 Tax=Trichoderma arundinaceum TaxID=490622 RepID=A0A395NYF1_TRIAR|nr:polyketide synthase [Trichoderma arundinaceum]